MKALFMKGSDSIFYGPLAEVDAFDRRMYSGDEQYLRVLLHALPAGRHMLWKSQEVKKESEAGHSERVVIYAEESPFLAEGAQVDDAPVHILRCFLVATRQGEIIWEEPLLSAYNAEDVCLRSREVLQDRPAPSPEGIYLALKAMIADHG